MAMYGVDCEESTLGQDVAKDSRSYFGHLLNQGLWWVGYHMVSVADGLVCSVLDIGRILVPCPFFGLLLLYAKKTFLEYFLLIHRVWKQILKQISGTAALFIYLSIVDGSQRIGTIEGFIEDDAISPSYDLAPPQPPPSPLPSTSCLSFSVFLCVASRCYWPKGLEEEPNHTTARKAGPL